MRGHIRKRGEKRGVATWEIKYELERDGGQRQTRYRSFKGSRREAQAELTRLLGSVQTGNHVEPHKLTVAKHVRNRVAQWRAAGIISVKTAERYEELVEYQLARFMIG